MSHTPGPWAIGAPNCNHDNQTVGIESDEWTVADVFGDVGGLMEHRDANARLIAAAPDLLAACEAAYARMLQLPHAFFRAHSQPELCDLLQAIAKATGRDEQELQNEFEARARQ